MRMSFNAKTGRWGVPINGTVFDFHCGDGFYSTVNGKSNACRMEMDADGWYYLVKGESEKRRNFTDLAHINMM